MHVLLDASKSETDITIAGKKTSIFQIPRSKIKTHPINITTRARLV
jgi:hypothetical protein